MYNICSSTNSLNVNPHVLAQSFPLHVVTLLHADRQLLAERRRRARSTHLLFITSCPHPGRVPLNQARHLGRKYVYTPASQSTAPCSSPSLPSALCSDAASLIRNGVSHIIRFLTPYTPTGNASHSLRTRGYCSDQLHLC